MQLDPTGKIGWPSAALSDGIEAWKCALFLWSLMISGSITDLVVIARSDSDDAIHPIFVRKSVRFRQTGRVCAGMARPRCCDKSAFPNCHCRFRADKEPGARDAENLPPHDLAPGAAWRRL